MAKTAGMTVKFTIPKAEKPTIAALPSFIEIGPKLEPILAFHG
jgi:hypothetical protein